MHGACAPRGSKGRKLRLIKREKRELSKRIARRLQELGALPTDAEMQKLRRAEAAMPPALLAAMAGLQVDDFAELNLASIDEMLAGFGDDFPGLI